MTNNTSPTMAVSIDLQPVWVDSVGYKIGINVGFEADKNQVPFEFDTGGPGFWSAYDGADSSWWPQINPVCSTKISMSYASGIEYQACPVNQPLFFKASSYSNNGTDLTDALIGLAPIEVAQIQSASGGDIQNWQDHANKGNPPPLYSNFYGDFGVVIKQADAVSSISSVLTQAVVTSVNNQTITNYPINNAYIIEVGPYPGEAQKSLPLGSLKMGLIGEPPQSWTSIQMDNSGSVQCTLTLQKANGTLYTCGPIPVLLDTGTPSTHLWTGDILSQTSLESFSSDGSTLESGMTLKLTASNGAVLMNFVTGTDNGKNLVKFTPGKNASGKYAGLVNTGLQPFFGNQVMFDFSLEGNPYLRFTAGS